MHPAARILTALPLLALMPRLLPAQELVYVKEATREETRRASLAATLKPIRPFRQSRWMTLGDGNLAVTPGGKIDLDAEVYGPDGKPLQWTPRPELKDGEWHTFDGSITWLYRTLESPSERPATFTVGSDPFVNVILNGTSVQAYGTTSAMPDRKGSFGAKLLRGTNHLLVRVSGPGAFSYEVSPLTAAFLRKLEGRLNADFPITDEEQYYRLETIDLPEERVLEVGGLAFLPGGSTSLTTGGTLLIATRRGEIWAYTATEKVWERPPGRDPAVPGSGPEVPPTAPKDSGDNRWHLFASGLHEPLGLCVGKTGAGGGLAGAELFVLQRPELTRVVDTDSDGAADRFETVCEGWTISVHQHEYLYGPVRDREGNFWCAFSGIGNHDHSRYLGWSFKVTPQGEFVPWSCGLRSENGICITPEGDLFIADNQGDYVGTSPLHHVTKGAFHGHPVGLLWDPTFKGDPFTTPIEELDKRRKPPAVLFPYGPMGQSLSQPLVDTTAGKFGPFAGQMFIGDQSKSNLMRVCLEKVDGEFQGACFPFRSGCQSGNNRLAYAPDGSLYVGQTDRGWASVGGQPYGLQRLVWTGKTKLEILRMELTATGFDLVMTRPVDPATASDPAAYTFQHYRYLYHKTYGSPQVDNTPAAVKAVTLSSDRTRISLALPGLVAGRIYELQVRGLRAADGTELLHPAAYYTLNRLKGN